MYSSNEIHTASSFSRPVPRPHSYSQLSTNDLAGEVSFLAERSSTATVDCVQLPAEGREYTAASVGSKWRQEYTFITEKQSLKSL